MNPNELSPHEQPEGGSQIHFEACTPALFNNRIQPGVEPLGKRFFFSVGEPSGDQHGANLIRSLRCQSPRSSFRGFGGTRMIQAGMELDFDLTSMAVMGFKEVLPKLKEFFRIADLAESVFARGEADAVVLVDFPGFNWHIAKRAKKYNLPVYYYLPPQLWAWGGWRVKKMRKYVDHVLCNLPFETSWFEQKNVPATYVGHPFFDQISEQELDEKFIQRWRDKSKIQVSVLPGSRDHEVKHIWPLQLQAIRILAEQFPRAQFMVAALKDSHAIWCRNLLTKDDAKLPIQIYSDKTSEILEMCDCSIMKSGSSSLELMARGKPATVMYHVSQSTYLMAKMLVKIKSISLPNLIADEQVLPESISYGSLQSKSSQASVQFVVNHMTKLIGDAEYRTAQSQRLLNLAEQFAKPGASEATATFLLDHLQKRSPTLSAPAHGTNKKRLKQTSVHA